MKRIWQLGVWDWLLLLALVLSLVALGFADRIASAGGPNSCAYSRDIEVTSCDSSFEYLAFPFSMPSSVLIAQGMMQADADDVYVTEGGTSRKVFACSLSSATSSYRTFTENLGAGNTKELTTWFGDVGERDQYYVCSRGDLNYSRSSDFSVSSGSSFYVLATFNAENILSGTYSHIVGKPGCYELVVGGGSPTAVWRVWEDSYTGTTTYSICPYEYLSSDVDCWGEATPSSLCDNGTSTYVRCDGGGCWVWYNLDDYDPYINLDEEVVGLSTRFQFFFENGATTGTVTITFKDSNSGSTTAFAPVSVSGGVPTWYVTGSKSTSPGGTYWGGIELRNLEVKVDWSVAPANWSQGRLSELQVVVQTRSSKNSNSVSLSINEGEEYTFVGYYLYNAGSPSLLLYDMTNNRSGTSTYSYSSIRDFGQDFHLGEFYGVLNNVRMRIE